jgi:hypothetical protein
MNGTALTKILAVIAASVSHLFPFLLNENGNAALWTRGRVE